MVFEIDVSGSDIFEKDYAILVAETGNRKIMLGHRFPAGTIEVIRARHGQSEYRYKKSKEGKSNLKVRLYCVAIYFLFKELKRKYKIKEANLNICRDFSGKEENIRQNIGFLLGKKLGLMTNIAFCRLPANSVAHRYAYLLRKDNLNKFSKYNLQIGLGEFEEFLKK